MQRNDVKDSIAVEGLLLSELGWTEEDAQEARWRLLSMELYDDIPERIPTDTLAARATFRQGPR